MARRTAPRAASFIAALIATVGVTVSAPALASGVVPTGGGAPLYVFQIFGQVVVFSIPVSI